MVKPVQKAEIKSLVKGFLTEFSPLNFPADASRDEENYELNRDGSRDRRLGIDLEPNYQLHPTGYSEETLKGVATSSYKWFNAGNNADNEFIIVQFGTRIDVFNSAKQSISKDGFIGSVTLTGPTGLDKFSYASVDGTLVIAAGTEDIHIIKYVSPNLVYSKSRLLVRDLWGLPGLENNDINTRTAVRSDSLIYNLQNQGWGVPRKNSGGTLTDPIATFYAAYGTYPSNAEVVYTGLQFQPVTSGTPFERMYPAMYDDSLGLDYQAARGYFIIDALKRGTYRLEAFNANKVKFPSLSQTLTDLPDDYTPQGARIAEDYAGRVFYAGFGGEVIDGSEKSPVLSSYVLFSQLIKGQDGFNRCYQVGDPTSRENSDVVDSDGGFIRISGAKKIYGLVALSTNLFVIADNGVWTIVGGNDYGFSATNYAVNKLSSYGCFNSNSIVTVNDSIFFFGNEGIFVVERNQYGDWVVTNISEGSIQTFYDELEDADKRNSIGVYDLSDKKIRWMINQDTDRTNNNVVRELIFDLVVKAFSKVRIFNLPSNTPEVVGYVQTSSFVAGEVPVGVVANTVPVVVAGENVVIQRITRTSGLQSIKYITLYSSVSGSVGYTFSQYQNSSFRDWEHVDGVGVDAKAYILTGQVTANDSAIAKQAPYLVMHFRRTEDGVEEINGQLVPSKQSSCLTQSQWDWANSINSGKWSEVFQAYRYRRPYLITSMNDTYDNGFETVVSKNKLRGRGKAISLYLETEPGKDCRILGWNLSLTGNSL